MPVPHPDWLITTVNAVRELMIKRLAAKSLDADSEREVQMALEELEVMWEELQGQAEILSREHERYQEFFEYAPDAYVITDAGGNIREANRAASELLGLARDDIVGKSMTRFVPEDDRTALLTRYVALDPKAKPQSWDGRLQPRAGAPLRALFSVRAMPLQKSGIAGLCWLIRAA